MPAAGVAVIVSSISVLLRIAWQCDHSGLHPCLKVKSSGAPTSRSLRDDERAGDLEHLIHRQRFLKGGRKGQLTREKIEVGGVPRLNRHDRPRRGQEIGIGEEL